MSRFATDPGPATPVLVPSTLGEIDEQAEGLRTVGNWATNVTGGRCG